MISHSTFYYTFTNTTMLYFIQHGRGKHATKATVDTITISVSVYLCIHTLRHDAIYLLFAPLVKYFFPKQFNINKIPIILFDKLFIGKTGTK